MKYDWQEKYKEAYTARTKNPKNPQKKSYIFDRNYDPAKTLQPLHLIRENAWLKLVGCCTPAQLAKLQQLAGEYDNGQRRP